MNALLKITNGVFKIIKETNGDLLGIVLFILLIIYFISLENQTYYTDFLLGGCITALIVDLNVTYKVIKNQNPFKLKI